MKSLAIGQKVVVKTFAGRSGVIVKRSDQKFLGWDCYSVEYKEPYPDGIKPEMCRREYLARDLEVIG